MLKSGLVTHLPQAFTLQPAAFCQECGMRGENVSYPNEAWMCTERKLHLGEHFPERGGAKRVEEVEGRFCGVFEILNGGVDDPDGCPAAAHARRIGRRYGGKPRIRLDAEGRLQTKA